MYAFLLLSCCRCCIAICRRQLASLLFLCVCVCAERFCKYVSPSLSFNVCHFSPSLALSSTHFSSSRWCVVVFAANILLKRCPVVVLNYPLKIFTVAMLCVNTSFVEKNENLSE